MLGLLEVRVALLEVSEVLLDAWAADGMRSPADASSTLSAASAARVKLPTRAGRPASAQRVMPLFKSYFLTQVRPDVTQAPDVTRANVACPPRAGRSAVLSITKPAMKVTLRQNNCGAIEALPSLAANVLIRIFTRL
jgi:hypothetical protein